MIDSDQLRHQRINAIVLDFESESLNHFRARPWQASWLVIENNQIVSEHDHFIWWDNLEISKKAAEVTRFNYDLYKQKAKPGEPILEELESYLYNPKYLFIGYNNLGFDAMIHQVFRRQFAKSPDYSFIPRTFDVLCLARSHKLKKPYNKEWNLTAWQFSLLEQYSRKIKCGLGTLAKDFKLNFDDSDAHDAIYDVRMTWSVFRELLKVCDI